MVPLRVLEVGSSRTVAVCLARSGDAGGGASLSTIAVVAHVAVGTCDALAALMLPGALVSVAVALWATVASTTSLPAPVVASTVVASTPSTSNSCVREPAWLATTSAAADLAATSSPVAPSLVLPLPASSRFLARVPVTAVACTPVVVEAEANPVSLVLKVARRRMVVSPLAVARSTHVPQSRAAVSRTCTVGVGRPLRVGGVALGDCLAPVGTAAAPALSQHS